MIYEELGDRGNPPVIFLHGAMVKNCFFNQRELSDRYNLILYNLPGHGKDERDFDRATAVEEVEYIAKNLLKPAHLVGFSLGAQLALSLLDKSPECFKKAVLVSPLIDSTEADNMMISLSSRVVGYSSKIFPVSRIVGGIIGIDKNNYCKFEREQKSQKVGKLSSDIFKDMLKSSDIGNISRINNKILILAGQYEMPCFIRSAAALSKMFKNAETDIYPGAAHNIPYRFYEKFNSRLRQFLSE